MEKFKEKYISKPYQAIGGQIETLTQCLQITHDGDLISKSDRDEYVKKNLITRSNGFNIVSETGIKYLNELGIISC